MYKDELNKKIGKQDITDINSAPLFK